MHFVGLQSKTQSHHGGVAVEFSYNFQKNWLLYHFYATYVTTFFHETSCRGVSGFLPSKSRPYVPRRIVTPHPSDRKEDSFVVIDHAHSEIQAEVDYELSLLCSVLLV
jgi:hypothetical protein